MKSKHLLCLLPLLLAAAPVDGDEARGYGPWRLGMSADEVKRVSEFGPYSPVTSTGGLETPNARFEGEKIYASFVFGSSGLFHIQLWAYEGNDYAAALTALHRVYGYLSQHYGAVATDQSRLPADLSEEQLEALLPPEFKANDPQYEQLMKNGRVQAEVQHFHIHPLAGPDGMQVYASLMHSPQLGTYHVFLYFKAPRG